MGYQDARGNGLNNGAARPDIQSHLASSERVISVFGPFYATSSRVLRLDPPNGPSKGHLLEIPYNQLTSVEMVRRSNHPVLILGTVMVILGLMLSVVLFFSTILVILLGGAFLYVGAKGKPGYFQLSAREMPKQAEKFWQVEYDRSGNFIATVRSAIGQMPEF